MEGDSSQSGTSAPRLCIFCRRPGPQYSLPSHKKENIRSEAHISKIWLCNACLENKNFDGIGNLTADGETDDHGRLMPKPLYLPNDKSHVKSCWTRLRTALDSLYVKILQESEEGLVNSIEKIVVSQSELVNCAHICAEEDSVQLLQRIDAQAQKYVLQCKQRLIVHSLSKKFGKLGPPSANHMKIPWADSYFLKLALGYWEKYSLVSRAAAILLRPMQEICSVHWGTQTRCIFHRAIYSHIDIQDRLRTISNAVQVSLVSSQLSKIPINVRDLQEAAQTEELASWNVRGTMRRYRKFEEEMTKASQDREPESCRYLDSVPLGTYGRKSHYMCNFLTEDWHFYSDEEDTDADDEEDEEEEDEEESKENLLLNDSSESCTDTLSDALSEEDEEAEETDEEEFENEMKNVQGEFKKMLMVHEGLSREVSKCLEEYRAAHSSEDSADEFVRQHIAKKKREEKAMKKRIMQFDYESSSTETSISTESEDSSEETEELCSDEDTMAVWKVIERKFTSEEAKRQLGLSPSPSDIPNELLNNTPKKKKNTPEKSTGELFKNIVEKSKLNKSSANGSKLDNGKCKVDKAARPVAAAKSNENSTPSKKVEKENQESHEQHTCMSDHEDGEHDHYSEHHPCHCVHCELLGNTPNQRGNFRDEQARARLRKKLEKRKQASGQPMQCPDTKCQHKCDAAAATTRQAGDESSSPTLSTRSTVSSQKESRTGTPQAKTAKRQPFSFSTAMDLRPVRSSTSSKNIETNTGDNDGKREWVDCAYEDILDMCHDKKLKNTPQNASLNSVQSWLRTAIKDRLDAQKDVKLPVHQIIAEEVIAAEEAEKAAEEAKRLKKKKKKQAAKQRKDEIKRLEEAKLEAEQKARQKIDDEEAERKAQEKREEEEMENVFTPVDNLDGLDPDDRDVERFKRFCLEFVPKFPRLKIPLQSLNLPPLVLPQ